MLQSEEDQVFQTQKEQFVLYTFTQHSQTRQYTSLARNPKPKLIPVFPQKQLPFNTTNAMRSTRQPAALPTHPTQHFSKNFESGNLDSVKILQDGTIRLRVANDCNSKKQSQWFYFSCRGVRKAKFSICGFGKEDSLYNYGMRVCVKENGVWGRGGDGIGYERDEEGQGYVLNFSYRFKNPNAKTYFAYCFPYTYSELLAYLAELEKRKLPYLSSSTITKSLLKNEVFCLTITNPQSNNHNKEVIVITARVHPGQTVSSHIAHGFINAILSDTPQAVLLRDKYIFKVIPMINPDGVVLGNYRLSYSGNDLNRKWRDTSSRLHPEVYYTKKMLMSLNKTNKIRMLIDMHGHSRNKNVFFYGCKDKYGGNSAQEFPYLMSKIHSAFSFKNCSFAMQKSKEGTQRIAMNYYLKLPYIYTLESSFCGNQGTNTNYSISDLQTIGSKLVEGLAIYLSPEISKPNLQIQLLPKMIEKRSELIEDFSENAKQNSQDDFGSDSTPSQGCYRQQQLLRMLRTNHFIPAGNFDSKRDTSYPTSQSRFRSFSTSKKKSPQILINCKINTINGNLFDRSSPDRTLKKTQPIFQKLLSQQQQPSKNYPTVVIVNNLYPTKPFATTSRNSSYNQAAQYKRVKKYTEQLLSKSEKRRDRNSLELDMQLPPRRSFRETITIQDREPKALKIHEAKFAVNIANIHPRQRVLLEDRKNQTLCLAGFNRSMKAKEYLEERTVGPLTNKAARGRQIHF